MKGIWISAEEVAALPTSGPAWEAMFNAAQNAWGQPNLADQNNKHGLRVLAGALVATKMDSESIRAAVRAHVMAAKRTFDQPGHWNTSNGVLALGRLLPAYVIAADLVGLSIENGAEFTEWLTTIRTQKIGTHGRWSTLTGCHENDAANWAAFAGAARVAASAYLGDEADLARAADVLRALFGERDRFPGGGYFQPSSGLHWSLGDDSTWVGINGPGSKSIGGQDRNVDGCPVIDTGDGPLAWPPPSTSYPWECIPAWMMQAEILHRLGYDSYGWSNQAMRRCVEFMFRAYPDGRITNPARHVLWVMNARYGASFPTTSPNTDGRAVCWTDWTHAVGVPPPPPPDDLLPSLIDFVPTSGAVGAGVTIRGAGFVDVLDVMLGGRSAVIVSVNANEIQCFVPEGAVTGHINVITVHGAVSSPEVFTVTSIDPPPPPPGAPDPRVAEMLAALNEYADAASLATNATADAADALSTASSALREKIRAIMGGS